MLKRLRLKNFTVFADATFEFASGLNVIIGENGTGKSHLMKAAYVFPSVSFRLGNQEYFEPPHRKALEVEYARKLKAVMRPDTLGRIITRQRGRARCEVQAEFSEQGLDASISFSSASRDVVVDVLPSEWEKHPPVFLPSRELLSIYPGFVPLYETAAVVFEETWRDTCLLLGAPARKGRPPEEIRSTLATLEEVMGGGVILDKSGRFYVNLPGGTLEAHLVAEGLRKLAMIARLIATGSLTDKTYLFWDEPEANLNPKIVKMIASTILHLCRAGVQVFIATHSLFLLREFDILFRAEEFAGLKRMFTSLHGGEEGVEVRQHESVDGVGAITSLDEELEQEDRYLAPEMR